MGKVHITINEQPIDEWEDPEEQNEIRTVRNEDSYKHIYKPPLKKKFKVREKDSPVRYLTRNEIRKEYGYMSVKNDSLAKEILEILYSHDDPMSPQYIAEELGLRLDQVNKNVSPTMSTLYKFLGDTFVDRVKHGKTYYYFMTEYGKNCSVDYVHLVYSKGYSKYKQKSKHNKKPEQVTDHKQKSKESGDLDNDKQDIESENISILNHQNKDSYKDNESGGITININVTFRLLF